jgi:hypothetical protein
MSMNIFVSEVWSRERSAGLREYLQWKAHRGSGEPGLVSIVKIGSYLYQTGPPFLATANEQFYRRLPPTKRGMPMMRL